MNTLLVLALTLFLNAVIVVADPILALSDGENYQTMPKALATAKTLSNAEIYKTMEQTLFDIRDAFKKIKQEYPQLADIDNSTIKKDGLGDSGRIRFDYERGIAKEGFLEGATFAKNGCDMVVQIEYPATKVDVEERRLKGNLIQLKNGNSYAVWYLVRAEPDVPGQTFINKANEIISFHLKKMQEAFQ